MCGYGLHNVKSRRAKVGDKLTARNFGTGTPGSLQAPHTRRPVYRYTFARTRSATGSLPDAWCAAPRECHKFSFLSQCCPNCEGVLAAGVLYDFLNAVSTARRYPESL